MEAIRNKVATKFKELTGEKLFLAPWDGKRIAFEDTAFCELQYGGGDSIDRFYEVLELIAPEGYFIESINSCEAHICRV